jgi:hypothetical protein
MVDNSISPCELISGSFSPHSTVQVVAQAIGAGPTTDEWAQERRQAGQSSGVRGGAGDVGLWYAWPLLLGGKAEDGASADAKAAPD